MFLSRDIKIPSLDIVPLSVDKAFPTLDKMSPQGVNVFPSSDIVSLSGVIAFLSLDKASPSRSRAAPQIGFVSLQTAECLCKLVLSFVDFPGAADSANAANFLVFFAPEAPKEH
jgi:hypothetical protein